MYTLKKQDIISILNYAKLNKDKPYIVFESTILGEYKINITPLESSGYIGSVVSIDTVKDSSTFIIDKFTQNINITDSQYDALSFVINNNFNL